MAVWVSPKERDFVQLVRAMAGYGELRLVEDFLYEAQSFSSLSPPALQAFEDTLRKAAARFLLRAGGARRDLRKTNTGFRVGRVWDADPLSPLRFTDASFTLFHHLFTHDVRVAACPPAPEILATGDQVVLFWICHAHQRLGLPLQTLTAWMEKSPLVSLAFAYGSSVPWSDTDLWLLGFLQGRLAQALVTQVRNGQTAAGQGLSALTSCCLSRERPDLLGFLVDALVELFPKQASPAQTVATLVRDAPADNARQRQATRGRVSAFLQPFVELGRHHQRCRHVGFVDDGYELAQAVLRRWDPFGSDGFARVAQAVDHLGSLSLTEGSAA